MAAVLLMAGAIAHLAWRGPVSVRGHVNLCDFASPWASARLLVAGENPYQNDRLWPTWITSPGAFETDHDFWLALMPPGALALLAPLTVFPASVAAVLFLALSVASVAVIILSVLQLAPHKPGPLAACFTVALFLASAPLQTALTVGQLSLPVAAMIFGALCLLHNNRALAAAVILGVATAMKPQLAAPFFFWFVFFRHWRALGLAFLITVGITLAGILPMHLHDIPWYSDWLANVRLSTMPGSPNDPTDTGPWRNQMIDLRVWLFTLVGQRELVLVKGLVASTLLALAFLWMLGRWNRRAWMLPLATFCALVLLPVYHKAYDAILLLPALAWAILNLRDARRSHAIATLICLSPFLIPFDFLPLIMKRTTLLDPLAETWVWRVFVYPHYALATLATALCLMAAMHATVKDASDVTSVTEIDPSQQFDGAALGVAGTRG